MAVRARGSTGCTISSSSTLGSVRFEFDRRRAIDPSVRLRCSFMLVDATLPRCLTDAYVGQSASNVVPRWCEKAVNTAFGRCSMPTLKSHSSSRQSSPTLPIR